MVKSSLNPASSGTSWSVQAGAGWEVLDDVLPARPARRELEAMRDEEERAVQARGGEFVPQSGHHRGMQVEFGLVDDEDRIPAGDQRLSDEVEDSPLAVAHLGSGVHGPGIGVLDVNVVSVDDECPMRKQPTPDGGQVFETGWAWRCRIRRPVAAGGFRARCWPARRTTPESGGRSR